VPTITTVHDVQQTHLLTAARSAAVATAAGVAALVWASTTAPRVHVGDAAGFLSGLHRGRLPAVEMWPDSEGFGRQTRDGGTVSTVWVARCLAAGPSQSAAGAQARRILMALLATIRADEYLSEGDGSPEAFGSLTSDPLGHTLEVRFSLVSTFDRATYGSVSA
jgi:hypothetical protein